MNYKYYKYRVIFTCHLLLTSLLLNGHGFASSTKVKMDNGYAKIEELYDKKTKAKKAIKSYDIRRKIFKKSSIHKTGKSITNCFLLIHFNENECEPISCTPSQEFYHLLLQEWVSAFHLHPGDILLAANGNYSVQKIDFFEDPLCVYGIEVKKTHTYFVAKQEILTHNICLPLTIGGIAASFTCGAASGGSLGSIGGSVACISGMIVGGMLGSIIKSLFYSKKIQYASHFDTENIRKTLFNQRDNLDPQAPGKPSEKDGFYPKKNWDGKKVKHRRGYGWPDKKGNIWIPTGPNGHGGPHWDVQKPNGEYENIVPGGKTRGEK